jgi:predicted branched-subunit amino acid permease
VISLRADRSDVAAGARTMAPWLAGVVPFGLVIGVSAAHADVPMVAGWLTGPLIYAGSSQLATIGMLGARAALVAVVAVALVINVRLIFYSAAMARYWRGTPWWWRLVAGYLLADPSVAVGLDGYRRLGRDRGHAHYLGGAVLLWVFRLSMIILTDRIMMPAYLERASGLVAPAAFAALAAAGVAAACSGLGITETAAKLAAVAAAVIAVLRTGSSRAAILAGMPALWVATALLPS